MLPLNTYYKDGALINRNRGKNNIKARLDLLESRIINLENKLTTLIEKLNNANK